MWHGGARPGSRSSGLRTSVAPNSRRRDFDPRVDKIVTGYLEKVRSQGVGGVVRDVLWVVVPGLWLIAVMVGLGYLVTDVLPSSALGRWDADVPRRLVEYRRHDGISESKFITTLSATP